MEYRKKSKYKETPGPLKLKSFIDAVIGNSMRIVGIPQQGQELV